MATASPTRSSPAPIGGWSLIVGGIAFGLFWGLAPIRINDDLPSVAGLAVHGVSIVALLLAIALLWLASLRGNATTIVSAGAAMAALGVIAFFPLLPLGLAVMTWGLLSDGWPRVPCRVLLAGSLSLLATTVARQITAGAAIAGEDGAPALSLGWTIWFEISILLVAVGLIWLGRERLAPR